LDYDFSISKDGGLPFNSVMGLPLPLASAGVLDEYGFYEWEVTTHSADGEAWKSATYPFYVTIQKSPKPGRWCRLPAVT